MDIFVGEQKSFLDLAEAAALFLKKGVKRPSDELLREAVGGGSFEKISPQKRAAFDILEEAFRRGCPPPEFLLAVLSAYLGRYEERGRLMAHAQIAEKDETIGSLSGKVAALEKEIGETRAENNSLKEDARREAAERERSHARIEERERYLQAQIQELIASQNSLRQSLEQANIRVSLQDQALWDRGKSLENAHSQVEQLSGQMRDMEKELAGAKEELSGLRVKKEALQDRIEEFQKEVADLKNRGDDREEKIRRLHEELRAVERRCSESREKAAGPQMETDRFNLEVESQEQKSQSAEDKSSPRKSRIIANASSAPKGGA